MRLPSLAFLLLLLVWLPGCFTSGLDTPVREAPAYTRGAQHYRSFGTADALAASLRKDAPTGPLLSAHRGGPAPGYPENALATFERALRYAPALIECDVRMTRDSVLVLMHDETLDRTTTGTGEVSDATFAELRGLLLKDNLGITTPFRIPTLSETLAWAAGRAVLTLDVKRGVPPRRVVDAIRRLGAEGQAIIIVYDFEDLLRYHQLAPELVISASADTVEEVEILMASGVDLSRLIVFTGVGEMNAAVVERLHARNIRAMLGTFGTVDRRAEQAGAEVYQAFIDRGIDVIATDNVPLAARAVQAYSK